jgi:predicted oxidoreductase (fatty acid repression mutant protein)
MKNPRAKKSRQPIGKQGEGRMGHINQLVSAYIRHTGIAFNSQEAL